MSKIKKIIDEKQVSACARKAKEGKAGGEAP